MTKGVRNDRKRTLFDTFWTLFGHFLDGSDSEGLPGARFCPEAVQEASRAGFGALATVPVEIRHFLTLSDRSVGNC